MILSFDDRKINKTKTTDSKPTINKTTKGNTKQMKISNLLAYELIPTNDANVIEFDDILS